MDFRIKGLDASPFLPLFGLADEELAARQVVRYRADAKPGFPDRVSLRDAEPGESVLLLHHTHHDAATPYRASHAIFVTEREQPAYDAVNQIPDALGARLLSLRAFDAAGMMIDADVVDGREAEPLIRRLLADARAAFLHAHFARRGCYAARIERA
jgi:hypothetical protein